MNSLKNNWSLILFIFLFLVINQSFGERLKGKIKSYRESYYSSQDNYGKLKKGPKLEDPRFHDEFVTFDQNGNISQSVEYNFDGTIYCKYNGRYDYMDNNIESIYVNFEPELKILRKPFILESVRYSWGEQYKMTYKIDFKVRPLEETIYDLIGRAILTIEIKRDENGNSIEDRFSDGTIDKFKYDKNGNRIEWVSVAPGGNTTIVAYKYDASGNIIEKNVNNFFKSTYKFHYDNYTYKYLFDKRGNWIERIDYENEKPQRIAERTIEYAK
jgi:hypothetical protein